MNTHIIILSILLIIAIIGPLNIENFYVKDGQRQNHKVQVGTLHNSSKEVNELMDGLNEAGGQALEDSKNDDKTAPLPKKN